MTYPLPAPLTPHEADALAERLAFTRTVRAGLITATFDSPATRDRAAQIIRAARMDAYRAQ